MNKSDNNNRIVTKIPSVRGRPKKWKTPEELQGYIEDYFNSCFMPVQERITIKRLDEEGNPISETKWVDRVDKNGDVILEQVNPFTITGLAVALDSTRETLLDYENKPENAQFSDTIKKAKQIIHNYAENYLFTGKNQTGAIFNLKNNYGWVDKTETDLTTKGKEISTAVVSAKADDILNDD